MKQLQVDGSKVRRRFGMMRYRSARLICKLLQRTSTLRATRHQKRHLIALWLAPSLLSCMMRLNKLQTGSAHFTSADSLIPETPFRTKA